ncbi:hypothetical protein CerSpe_126630 [Prunus speciosa]
MQPLVGSINLEKSQHRTGAEVEGAPYYGTPGNNENEAIGHAIGQNAYEVSYGVPQGRAPFLPPAAAAGGGGGGYDAPRGPGYDAPRGPGYDASGGSGYDAQRGPGYDAQRRAPYDAQRPGYDVQRPNYEVQREASYDPSRGVNYDAQSRGAAGPQGHMPTSNV